MTTYLRFIHEQGLRYSLKFFLVHTVNKSLNSASISWHYASGIEKLANTHGSINKNGLYLCSFNKYMEYLHFISNHVRSLSTLRRWIYDTVIQ